jgi:cytoskeletal protein RodZ
MSYSLIVFCAFHWLVAYMSAEKIVSTEINDLAPSMSPKKSEEVSSSGRVDINVLLERVRKVKEKERRTNIFSLGLILSLIIVVGIILSF